MWNLSGCGFLIFFPRTDVHILLCNQADFACRHDNDSFDGTENHLSLQGLVFSGVIANSTFNHIVESGINGSGLGPLHLLFIPSRIFGQS